MDLTLRVSDLLFSLQQPVQKELASVMFTFYKYKISID